MSDAVPFSQEAEIAILSAILVDGSNAIDEIFPPLKVEAFFIRSHQIIVEAALDLHFSGRVVDLITVTGRLREESRLEEIGGEHGISKLASTNWSLGNLEEYAGMILEKYNLRKALEIATWIQKEAPVAHSAEEMMRAVESQVIDVCTQKKDDNLVQDCHMKLLEKIEALQNGRVLGLQTGLDVMDEFLGGWMPGNYVGIIAEAEVGKTSLIGQSILRLLDDGHPCLVLQKDMSVEDFYLRLACVRIQMSVWRLNRGFCKPEEYERLVKSSEELRTMPLVLLSERLTGSELRAKIKREKRKRGIEAVFIDHLRSLKSPGRDLREGIVQNSLQVRDSANDTRIPHIVLNHVNREGSKSKKPTINDIKESDQIKDDADSIVIMTQKGDRPQYIPGIDQVWEVEFDFQKNRNGPKGIGSMMFNGTRQRFDPKPKEDQQ